MAFSKQSSGEYSLSDKSSQPSDEESSPFLPGTDVAGQPVWGSREKRNTLFMALLCVAALMAVFFGGFTMGQKRHYSLDEGASMIRATDFGESFQTGRRRSMPHVPLC
ncbi:hypothetical protein RirG_011310 [Rhizophagus irregularis DAOM 197198w]|uniref:Uncharacterized protein n=1 Tax=Rhizophagus irregularis (strain DAOM 197198w) TaxID=1432141 RepID=A0A015M1H8_RHIIW|nr:hypothetical protein RirG_011310 [Rhizophagus irregularis DAOM 197198w]